MGQLFARYLRASGYPISILDRDDWDVAERILTNADVVIVSVPINHTLETIERFKTLFDGKYATGGSHLRETSSIS